MTDDILFAQIERDEGCRLTAYPDPLSGGEPWTVGYGCTGEDVTENTVWTQEQAEVALAAKIAANDTALKSALPWTVSLDPPRYRALANLQYNVGLDGLLKFRNMLSACQEGDYSQAAEQMLDSEWARQVGNRANRLAEQMRMGVDQP